MSVNNDSIEETRAAVRALVDSVVNNSEGSRYTGETVDRLSDRLRMIEELRAARNIVVPEVRVNGGSVVNNSTIVDSSIGAHTTDSARASSHRVTDARADAVAQYVSARTLGNMTHYSIGDIDSSGSIAIENNDGTTWTDNVSNSIDGTYAIRVDPTCYNSAATISSYREQKFSDFINGNESLTKEGLVSFLNTVLETATLAANLPVSYPESFTDMQFRQIGAKLRDTVEEHVNQIINSNSDIDYKEELTKVRDYSANFFSLQAYRKYLDEKNKEVLAGDIEEIGAICAAYVKDSFKSHYFRFIRETRKLFKDSVNSTIINTFFSNLSMNRLAQERFFTKINWVYKTSYMGYDSLNLDKFVGIYRCAGKRGFDFNLCRNMFRHLKDMRYSSSNSRDIVIKEKISEVAKKIITDIIEEREIEKPKITGIDFSNILKKIAEKCIYNIEFEYSSLDADDGVIIGIYFDAKLELMDDILPVEKRSELIASMNNTMITPFSRYDKTVCNKLLSTVKNLRIKQQQTNPLKVFRETAILLNPMYSLLDGELAIRDYVFGKKFSNKVKLNFPFYWRLPKTILGMRILLTLLVDFYLYDYMEFPKDSNEIFNDKTFVIRIESEVMIKLLGSSNFYAFLKYRRRTELSALAAAAFMEIKLSKPPIDENDYWDKGIPIQGDINRRYKQLKNWNNAISKNNVYYKEALIDNSEFIKAIENIDLKGIEDVENAIKNWALNVCFEGIVCKEIAGKFKKLQAILAILMYIKYVNGDVSPMQDALIYDGILCRMEKALKARSLSDNKIDEIISNFDETIAG